MIFLAPTITEDWLRCPTYGHLNRHWEPLGTWQPHKLVGKAFSYALKNALEPPGATNVGTPSTPQSPLEVLSTVITEGFIDQDDWPLETLISLASKGLKAALKETVPQILSNEKVLGTELDVGEQGTEPGQWRNARLDLLTERGSDLIITDHKHSLKLDAQWIPKRLLESEADWQLLTYAWLVQEKLNRPVKRLRRHLIVSSPKAKAYLHEYPLDQDFLQAWHKGAEKEWLYISSLKDLPLQELPMRLPSCYGKYGKCSFYEACHVANRDEAKMAALYQRRVNEDTRI